MRIAEIAVIAPQAEERKRFIAAVCDQIEVESERLTVGRLTINDQIVLHLYGLAPTPEGKAPAWDLLARKLLGYVALFSWQESDSFEHIKAGIDQVTARADAVLVVAAKIADAEPTALEALGDEGLFVNQQGKFTFYQEDDVESMKKVLLVLIDLLIERAE